MMNYSNTVNNLVGQDKDTHDQSICSDKSQLDYNADFFERFYNNPVSQKVKSPLVLHRKIRNDDVQPYRDNMYNPSDNAAQSSMLTKAEDIIASHFPRRNMNVKDEKMAKAIVKSPYLDTGSLRPFIKDAYGAEKRLRNKSNASRITQKQNYEVVNEPQSLPTSNKHYLAAQSNPSNEFGTSDSAKKEFKVSSSNLRDKKLPRSQGKETNSNYPRSLLYTGQRPSTEALKRRPDRDSYTAPLHSMMHVSSSKNKSEVFDMRSDVDNSDIMNDTDNDIKYTPRKTPRQSEEMFQRVIIPARELSYPTNFPFSQMETEKADCSPCISKQEDSTTRPSSALTMFSKETTCQEIDSSSNKIESLSNSAVQRKVFASTTQNFRVTTKKEQRPSHKGTGAIGQDVNARKGSAQAQFTRDRERSQARSKHNQETSASATPTSTKSPATFNSSALKALRTTNAKQTDDIASAQMSASKVSTKQPDKSSASPTRLNMGNDGLATVPIRNPLSSTITKFETGKRPKPAPKEKANTKYFVYNSQDDHIKRALKRYGWAESAGGSQIATLKWVYTDQENDYRALQKGQFYNHIPNNKELTTKQGLMNSFRKCQQHGVDNEQFFPRCYDLGSSKQCQEFKDDFERVSLTILLQKLWSYIKSHIDPEKVKAIKTKYERWQQKGPDMPKNRVTKNALRNLVLTEDVKNPKFIVHVILVELALLCTKRMLQQYTEILDELGAYSLQMLDKQTKAQLTQYSKFNPPYENIPAKDLVLLGGTDHCWQTPNEWAMYKIYKYNKMFKSVLPQHCINGMSNVWIIKPGSNARGQGIHLVDDLDEAVQSGAQNQARIIQKYVENPLVIQDPECFSLYKKKFDIRQWVLVTSVAPLKIYLFSSCYLRICSSDFDIKEIKDPMRHLTNFSVNKTQYKGRMEDSVCSLEYFSRYIRNKCNIEWDTQIKPGVINLINETLQTVADQLDPKPGCFELYGFDILLDEDYKPWLLEVNLSPACTERTPWLIEMLDYMAEGMLKLVLPKAVLCTEEVPDPDLVDLPKKEQYQWELIYTGDEIGNAGTTNNVIITRDLEVVGVKADIKKEKELDTLYLQYMASVKLQKLARGFICRRRLFRLKQKEAMIVIQKNVRVYLARKIKQALIRERSAFLIQKLLKINTARKYLQRRKEYNAATRLQSYYRMKAAIRKRRELERIRCAIQIQCMLRRFKARKEKRALEHRLLMIKRIQRFWKEKFIHVVRSAIKIQAFARMIQSIKARRKLKKYQVSVVKVQSTWRGKSARLKLAELKVEWALKQLAKTRHLRFGRAMFALFRREKSVRLAFGKVQRLQLRTALWKIKVTRRRRDRAAEKIQGLLKIIRAKRRAKRIRLVRATIKIQTFYRMRSARRRYLRVLKAYKSAVLIQRTVRAFLCSQKLKLKRIKRKEEALKQKRKQERAEQRKIEYQQKLELERKQQEHSRQLMETQTRAKTTERQQQQQQQNMKPSKRELSTKSPLRIGNNKKGDQDWSLNQYEKANFSGLKAKQSRSDNNPSLIDTNRVQDYYTFKASESPYKPSTMLVDKDNYQTLYNMFTKKDLQP